MVKVFYFSSPHGVRRDYHKAWADDFASDAERVSKAFDESCFAASQRAAERQDRAGDKVFRDTSSDARGCPRGW